MTNNILKYGLALMMLVMGANAFATGQQGVCPNGCTPGYWKNHTDNWVGYAPTDTIGQVFVAPEGYEGLPTPETLVALQYDTLLDALNYKGGKGDLGAAQIMLRQAVASLLNAAHPDVNFWWDEAHILSRAYTALYIGDREFIVTKGAWFQAYNELLCPLGRAD